jgi:DNA-binding response OmpR family regulator
MIASPLIVLWVDDDLSRDRPLRMELRRRGARVLMARSAERAIELSELFAVQLFVLSDEIGAVERGDLAAHFRSGFPNAEIILLSSKLGEGLHGVGLGLLYSGPRPLALETLITLLETAFPGRLRHGTLPRSEPATVLCVDDDPEMLRALARLLVRRGYRPKPLTDPRATLDVIPEVAPDLAILDVTMPGIDGYELARRIRSVYRNLIPVVMLSARASNQDIAAGYENGANAYLSKPCPPERLMDVVDYFAGDLDIEEFEALYSEGKGRGWKSVGVVR